METYDASKRYLFICGCTAGLKAFDRRFVSAAGSRRIGRQSSLDGPNEQSLARRSVILLVAH